jgi:hypothetical protein
MSRPPRLALRAVAVVVVPIALSACGAEGSAKDPPVAEEPPTAPASSAPSPAPTSTTDAAPPIVLTPAILEVDPGECRARPDACAGETGPSSQIVDRWIHRVLDDCTRAIPPPCVTMRVDFNGDGGCATKIIFGMPIPWMVSLCIENRVSSERCGASDDIQNVTAAIRMCR